MGTAAKLPRVGVSVFILNEQDDFVLGKRKGSHGAGTWGLPGGHLEYGESFEDCARRETLEETGLEIQDVTFWTASNSVFVKEGKHYVTIFVVCRRKVGSEEPQLLELNKCEGWKWISWNTALKWHQKQASGSSPTLEDEQLFLPITDLIEQHPSTKPQLA